MFKHQGGVFEGGVGDFGTRKHARQFRSSLILRFQRVNGDDGASRTLQLFNKEVVFGKAGDLCLMCYTENLGVARQPPQPTAYCLRDPASDPGIDLVENVG